MPYPVNRRDFVRACAVTAGASLAPAAWRQAGGPTDRKESVRGMKLGVVTYNIAKDWDVPTMIEKCTEIGIEGVELRTTHAHGVEPSLSAEERREVRARFEDSPVTLWAMVISLELSEHVAYCDPSGDQANFSMASRGRADPPKRGTIKAPASSSFISAQKEISALSGVQLRFVHLRDWKTSRLCPLTISWMMTLCVLGNIRAT